VSGIDGFLLRVSHKLINRNENGFETHGSLQFDARRP
jgi:hypothetical protein